MKLTADEPTDELLGQLHWTKSRTCPRPVINSLSGGFSSKPHLRGGLGVLIKCSGGKGGP